jgi:hypothetical protein
MYIHIIIHVYIYNNMYVYIWRGKRCMGLNAITHDTHVSSSSLYDTHVSSSFLYDTHVSSSSYEWKEVHGLECHHLQSFWFMFCAWAAALSFPEFSGSGFSHALKP